MGRSVFQFGLALGVCVKRVFSLNGEPSNYLLMHDAVRDGMSNYIVMPNKTYTLKSNSLHLGM